MAFASTTRRAIACAGSALTRRASGVRRVQPSNALCENLQARAASTSVQNLSEYTASDNASSTYNDSGSSSNNQTTTANNNWQNNRGFNAHYPSLGRVNTNHCCPFERRGTRSLWTLANQGPGARTRHIGSQLAPGSSGDNKSDTDAVGAYNIVSSRNNGENAMVQQQRRTFLGPVARVVAQLAATGAVVFGKAFMQAFAQAQANAKNPQAAAENMGIKKKEIDVGQAYEILGLESGATVQDVEEQFEKIFEANDPDKGGSFYLQSKVFHAKNALLEELNGGKDVHSETPLHEDKETK